MWKSIGLTALIIAVFCVAKVVLTQAFDHEYAVQVCTSPKGQKYVFESCMEYIKAGNEL